VCLGIYESLQIYKLNEKSIKYVNVNSKPTVLLALGAAFQGSGQVPHLQVNVEVPRQHVTIAL